MYSIIFSSSVLVIIMCCKTNRDVIVLVSLENWITRNDNRKHSPQINETKITHFHDYYEIALLPIILEIQGFCERSRKPSKGSEKERCNCCVGCIFQCRSCSRRMAQWNWSTPCQRVVDSANDSLFHIVVIFLGTYIWLYFEEKYQSLNKCATEREQKICRVEAIY